jgi:hypothetical protein
VCESVTENSAHGSHHARSNKSQGQTLPSVGLYLPKPVFGHGQLYVGLSRVGDPNVIKVLVVDGREQGRFDDRDGVWTVNIVYPEVLSEAQRLLHASLALRAQDACGMCECDGTCDGTGDHAGDATTWMDEADCGMPDVASMPEGADGANDADDPWDGGDDVDASAVDAAIERDILTPLRRTRVSHVPSSLLTHQQAWSLAHASEFVASTDDEMIDPWDADDGDEKDTPATRRAHDAVERTLTTLLAGKRGDCTLNDVMSALRAARFHHPRMQVVSVLRTMENDKLISLRNARIHLL